MNKKEHKPSAAMRASAKKGLEEMDLHSGTGVPSVTPLAVKVGKKIASGQSLADTHVNDMAHFHTSHDVCPQDVEDNLWGGPAGEKWAKSKLLQSINIGFAEEDLDFEKIISDRDVQLSLEVYSDIKLDEPVSLGEDDDGLIWAPILRSGMLATRPGPNGEKLDEPLVFVPGHSEDQRKEIGLQDIYDSFQDKAIEYVTLPTTHENNVLDNTGFIKSLKIADSVKAPGEKVILAGHQFTEPEIHEKVNRGTIPSRSCGLLYDYKNTTTGKVYSIALDHVALTHKPWMGGMTPYGSVSEEDFSERTIIPMMLSEKPMVLDTTEVEHTKPTELAQEPAKTQQPNRIREIDSEFLADIQWGDQPSYREIEGQIDKILQQYGSQFDAYPNYYVIDCTDGKALIKVNYGVGSDNDAWVAPYECKDGVVNLAPFSEWIDVQKKWVNDTEDPEQDKQQLDKLKMAEESIGLSVTQAERDKAHSEGNSLPDKSYPINNVKQLHAADTLAASGHGNVEGAKKLIRRRAKELGVDVSTLKISGGKKNKESKSNMSDPLHAASARRLGLTESINQPPGGSMELLAMSEEQMERLGLSEEAKEFQRQQNEKITKLNIDLSQERDKSRKISVEKRIEDLKSEGFDAFPGLLSEIEATMMSDDGDVALKLQLSDHGHNVEVKETATEIMERFIKALPREDGKVALGEYANRMETPELDRPTDKPVDPSAKDKPKDANALLAEWAEADPSLAKDPAFAGLHLSENGKGN